VRLETDVEIDEREVSETVRSERIDVQDDRRKRPSLTPRGREAAETPHGGPGFPASSGARPGELNALEAATETSFCSASASAEHRP
jgi:hypothetical protein